MDVRSQARKEILALADEGRYIGDMQPPEGMHPLAAEEWRKGYEDAIKQLDEEDSAWSSVEDVIVFVCKLLPLYIVAGVSIWADNAASYAVAAITITYILWRHWGPHHERKD